MIETIDQEGALVVSPTCDIVASSADALRQELRSLVDAGHHHLVIDLKQVSMLDSKGLAVFVLCHKSLKQVNGTFKVVTDNEDFRQLFHAMRLDQHFEVANSI